MLLELFFLYDTHCPWSYRAVSLVNQIIETYPDTKLQLMHCAHFDGEPQSKPSDLATVTDITDYEFSNAYLNQIEDEKDSTMTANLMAWVQSRSTKHALPLLNALFDKHFEQGFPLTSEDDVKDIIEQLKLSPPAKVFTTKKFTKDAEFAFGDIQELQELIATEAIPALLVAIDDNLILLNHNFYLKEPSKIIDAIELELAK